jgi:hypothetical protein
MVFCAGDGEAKKTKKGTSLSSHYNIQCCGSVVLRCDACSHCHVDGHRRFFYLSRMGSLLLDGVREPARTAAAAELVCSLSSAFPRSLGALFLQCNYAAGYTKSSPNCSPRVFLYVFITVYKN